jgi:RNA polymerase sigma factor (sigma-70 family)
VSGSAEGIGGRIADAFGAACHPPPPVPTSVAAMGAVAVLVQRDFMARVGVAVERAQAAWGPAAVDVEALVARLFEEEGRPLVRLARLFVDDRNAAEDLVQEGFIRLAHTAHRIRDESKAAAYLRSIVLNLARDHNRRGLVSLRHHLPFDDERASTEDEIVLRDDQREVIDALRGLPHRQRDCLVLRYYEELGIDDIGATLGISRNSVKTHLKRGLAAMEGRLGVPGPGSEIGGMSR